MLCTLRAYIKHKATATKHSHSHSHFNPYYEATYRLSKIVLAAKPKHQLRYYRQRLLSHISIDIAVNEMVSLIGPNGEANRR